MIITPDTEERPGLPPRSSQAAQITITHEGASDMQQSIRSAAYNHGLADLMTELLGEQAEDIICQRTHLGRGTVHRRLTGDSDWTVREIIYLADMLGLTPSRLVSAMSQVAVYGADLGQTAISLAHAAREGETR